MNAPLGRALAFGGQAPVEGRKVVRFVFLDEGGISKREPFIVVGDAVVHGDEQLTPLEDHLDELIAKHIPEEDREGFVFHSKDIFSGTRYFKDREKWPIERRLAILDDLVAIPGKFRIPLVFGFVQRAGFPHEPISFAPTQQQIDIAAHAVAFVECSLVIEEHMREAWPDEVAQLVAEDNDQARAVIRDAHAFLRSPRDLARQGVHSELLPLRKIRNSVHFAEKSESQALQLADVCTFFVRGRLSGHPHATRFYEAFRPWLVVLPKSDPVMAAWPFGPVLAREIV
jgi:hypothetical protein